MISNRTLKSLAVSIVLCTGISFSKPALAAGHARKGIAETALDRYVAKPDASYSWKESMSIRDESATAYAIDMTSQTWLTTNEVNRTAWRHWLLIVKPDNLQSSTALLFISGGANKGDKPPTPSKELIEIAKSTKSVVAELKMIPNQPLIFDHDGHERVEDDFIAYTWNKFLRTGDEKWPARLPMTKATVRGMDTITAFLASSDGGNAKVDTFVVAGASKRGWTTWTTAIVDTRVVAICPIVIDVLNTGISMQHHFQAYGFYAPAVGNYTAQGLMDWDGTPENKALYAIEDPYSYRDRLTMPKLMLNACGDQFFLPDSSQFYFNDLPGVKYLRYVPNADHSLKKTDAYATLQAWHHANIQKLPLPRFTWSNGSDGALTVKSTTKPKEVRLWQAHNDEARDFRLETLGPVWKSELVGGADGTYTATIAKPEKGWTAYMMEMTYDVGAATPLKLTTNVKVIPDTLPHELPHAKNPKGYLSR